MVNIAIILGYYHTAISSLCGLHVIAMSNEMVYFTSVLYLAQSTLTLSNLMIQEKKGQALHH